MRVCLEINATFESMETVSPSEPLFSEAAYVIMVQKSFDPLKSFKSVLEGFAIHKGDRGELLALLLLTLARDQAVGPPVNNGRPKCRFFSFFILRVRTSVQRVSVSLRIEEPAA
jgi:hypothetical protein